MARATLSAVAPCGSSAASATRISVVVVGAPVAVVGSVCSAMGTSAFRRSYRETRPVSAITLHPLSSIRSCPQPDRQDEAPFSPMRGM